MAELDVKKVEKRFVDEAVVEKKFVVVALVEVELPVIFKFPTTVDEAFEINPPTVESPVPFTTAATCANAADVTCWRGERVSKLVPFEETSTLRKTFVLENV